MKEKIIYQNTLAHLAQEEIELARPQTITENIDLTNIFLNEINNMIIKKQKIDISIHGRVRTGKSTLGIALAEHIINKIMIPLQLTKTRIGIQNIVRDQSEFTKNMRNPKLNNTVIVIDEWRELEEGGENITIEKAFRQDVNDVQARRYVHTIWISPRSVNEDAQSEIILETIEANRETKEIHARLYYNNYRGGITEPILIGHVTIPCQALLKKWNGIEDIFYKTEKTAEEQEKIEKTRKKDYYTEYYIKKAQKTDVMLEKGIFRLRELEYAKPVKDSVQQLKNLASVSTKLSKDIIMNYVSINCNKNKIPITEYGIIKMTNKTSAIIGLYKDLMKYKKELQKIIQEEEVDNGNTNIKSSKRKIIEETIKELSKGIEVQENNLDEQIKIKEELERIESTK